MNVLDLLEGEGVSKKNAEVTVRIFQKLNDIPRRDDVIDTFSSILLKNGKVVDSEKVKAVADVMMSRKKWSAKRLRDLYEGKKAFRMLTALHGISRGYGQPGDSVLDIFKKMVEAGAVRRQGQFTGITGEVEQTLHLEWWREQEEGGSI